jgi:DNA end-binding protein Ku
MYEKVPRWLTTPGSATARTASSGMAARAIWKGELVFGREKLAVKMFSAVEDRKIHFRLLDAKHKKPVRQRIVRKSDRKEVPKEERLKAFPLDRQTAVILRPDELKNAQPTASRDIELTRFIPRSALSEQWYDRPYYLGPEKDAAGYFAVARELERGDLVGIGRWVMRGQSYVGALSTLDGYLAIITLRRAEQIVEVSGVEIPASQKPDAKEVRLAEQIVESISGEFDPSEWQDEYHDRVCRMIADKARGKVLHLKAPKPRRATADLADTLSKSLAALKEKKVA